MVKKLLGKVVHYYPKAGIAVVEVVAEFKKGDSISVEGPETDVHQQVVSMQVDYKEIDTAVSGSAVGLEVGSRVRKGDHVYLE